MNKVIFIVIHLACFLAFWTGVSTAAVAVCLIFYFVRMFAITAGYHRYFSHRSYKTSRTFQFILAFLGAASAQKGPLWWASNHRHHHKHSDTEEDFHSPGLHGIWWAHEAIRLLNGGILSGRRIRVRAASTKLTLTPSDGPCSKRTVHKRRLVLLTVARLVLCPANAFTGLEHLPD